MNDNLVETWQGCPNCGERNVDLLLINDDEVVLCERCGHRYDLSKTTTIEPTFLERVKQFFSF